MPRAPFRKLLIANRGEIAIRIARAAADLGIASVAIYSEDDAPRCTCARRTKRMRSGARAQPPISTARESIALGEATGCDAIHPGYGFLAENAAFARAVAAAGLTFIGPSPEALDLFGDKAARERSPSARARR